MSHLDKYNYAKKSAVLLMVLGMLFPILPAILLFVAVGKPRITNNHWGARGMGILYLFVGLVFPILIIVGSKPGELGENVLGSFFLFGPWTLSGVASLLFFFKQRDFMERAGEVVFMVESGATRVRDLATKSGLKPQTVIDVVQDAIRLKVLRDCMLDRSRENIVHSSEIKEQYEVVEKSTVHWKCSNCGAHCSQEVTGNDSPKCTFCGTHKMD